MTNDDFFCNCPTCGRVHMKGGPHAISENEIMARHIEQQDDYRVLRRLKGWGFELDGLAEGAKTFKGIYVDVEATGLDVRKDDVIELGGFGFQFTAQGDITDLAKPLHYYNQPRKPISAKITELTGITNEMVEGRYIDKAELEEQIKEVDLVVAHHAGYDRPMLERVSPEFTTKYWGCSMAEVPWQEHGIAGKRLEYVLAHLGRFYEAHNAVSDCEAGLFALHAKLGDRSALGLMLDNVRKTTIHVWAVGAHYDYKDVLKERGYFWNGGEDGRPKAWHKEVEDGEAEKNWLCSNVYNRMLIPARFVNVTARDRFTVRDAP